MGEKTTGVAAKRMQAMLEDAGERSRALSRLLGWASEEANLLGLSREADLIRQLSRELASKQTN
jgi:hypothetical protein